MARSVERVKLHLKVLCFLRLLSDQEGKIQGQVLFPQFIGNHARILSAVRRIDQHRMPVLLRRLPPSRGRRQAISKRQGNNPVSSKAVHS